MQGRPLDSLLLSDTSGMSHRKRGGNGRGAERRQSFPAEVMGPARARALVGRAELFDKQLLLDTSSCVLPQPEDYFTTVSGPPLPAMQALKDRTNAIRSMLDHKDISVWHRLTSFSNQTGDVVRTVRQQIAPEMCTGAFVKMYEMLSRFGITRNAPKLRSVHVCEAPGAFICATNHYLRQGYGADLDWDWVGMTLNPYHEDNDHQAMVDDDRFILGSFNHWYFGHDDTGNVMKKENIEGLRDRCRTLGPVDLFTADGSINCSADPNEQESLVSCLVYCEVVAGLASLAAGGNMVVKMFTLFETQSIGLMYLLGCLFDELWVTKPATSKAGNAEVYVVAKGFRLIPEEHLEVLLEQVSFEFPMSMDGTSMGLLNPSSISEPFIAEMVRCADTFSGYFTSVITRNLDLDENGKGQAEDAAIRDCRRDVAKEYLRRCYLSKIGFEQRIVPLDDINGRQLNTGSRISNAHGYQKDRNQGRLSDRQELHDQRRDKRKRIRGDDRPAGTSTFTSRAPSPPPRADDGKRRAIHNQQDETIPANSGGEVARKMMESMGYQTGSGLGVDGRGIKNPIAVAQREKGTGLGFDAHVLPATSEIEGLPYFEQRDGHEGGWLQARHGFVKGDSCTQDWPKPLVAVRLIAVTSSKFCRTKLLEAMALNRVEKLPELLSILSKDQEHLQLLARISPAHAVLAYHNEHDNTFRSPSQAILVAQLDDLCHLFDKSTDNVTFLDFDVGRHGMSEYICNRYQEKATGWAVEPLRLDDGGWTCDSTWNPNACKANVTVVTGKSEELNTDEDVEATVTALKQARVDIALLAAVPPLDATAGEGKSYPEGITKTSLLVQIVVALQCLKTGGQLVLRIGDCFTRFTVGLIYLLYRSFDRVRILKPFCMSIFDGERILVCQGFLGSVQSVNDHLHATLQKQTDLLESVCEVLSLLPMTCLLEEHFLAWVTRANERIVAREAAALETLTGLVSLSPEAQAEESLIDPSFGQEAFLQIMGGSQPMATSTESDKPEAVATSTESDTPPMYKEGDKVERGGETWVVHLSQSYNALYFYNQKTGKREWVEGAS